MPTRKEAASEQSPNATNGVQDYELELSILMPCLNEAQTLPGCIQAAQSFISRNNLKAEILVSDNGSSDGSQEIATRAGARLVHAKTRGYGAALFYGSIAARGRYIIMGDADGSYDFSSLELFLEKLRQGYALVMGNRFTGGIRPGAMPWKNKYIGNPILSFIGKLLFNCPASDFHCGLRAFSKEAFLRMDLHTSGMEFASEMLIKSTLANLRICEIPTILYKDGRSRSPHLRPWRDGWRHLRFMLLFSPNWLFLYPGMALFLLSLAAMIRLLISPIHLGSIALDVNTLLFTSCGAIIGFQTISAAMLTRVYAVSEGLLPKSKALLKFRRFISLESALVLACALILIGLSAGAIAVYHWGALGFGNLNTQTSLRLVVPSVLCLALGVQVAVLGFMLGVLELKLRTNSETN